MSGFVIFAERFKEMSSFYARLMNLEISGIQNPMYLSDGINQVHLHAIPEEYQTGLSEAATNRFDFPIKPIFDVPLERINVILSECVIVKSFEFDGKLHSDVADPDGNIICIRS
jgi:hypothetical protein